jgi:hypothetical protein
MRQKKGATLPAFPQFVSQLSGGLSGAFFSLSFLSLSPGSAPSLCSLTWLDAVGIFVCSLLLPMLPQ